MHQLSMHSPYGDLTLFADDDALLALDWGWAPDQAPSPLLREAKRQLDAYFDGDLQAFDLPLDPAGTPFQQRVWQEMQKIPYGKTTTYGEMAQLLNTAAQPLGSACGANPLPIIIPCHRVLATGDGLGGYSGEGGTATKKALLVLEGALLLEVPDLFSYSP